MLITLGMLKYLGTKRTVSMEHIRIERKCYRD
jgi:hypothetical protein